MNGEKRSPAALIIGLILLAYALVLRSQNTSITPIGLVGIAEYLKTGRSIGTQISVGMWSGIIVTLIGIWNLAVPAMSSKFDKLVRAPMAGIGTIIGLAFITRYYMEPIFKIWGKKAEPALGFDMATIFGLNYILLGILLGIVWVNTIGIPDWMQAGVKTARLAMKMGVITLGAMYSITELKYLGGLSIVMVATFVMGTALFVLWLGKLAQAPRPLIGVLSAGLGVCGVSAAVAAAPVVKARGVDMAYSIGMLLLVGVVGLFIFPPVAKMVGMNELQFGAWAGTGILNSAQVAAAALIFDPHTIETLKVAEIFNITRILFLPFIVIVLAVWFAKGEEEAEKGKVNIGKVLIDKFPLFVLGFLIMFAFSSTGIFTPKGMELHGKNFYSFSLEEKKEVRTRDLKKIIGVPRDRRRDRSQGQGRAREAGRGPPDHQRRAGGPDPEGAGFHEREGPEDGIQGRRPAGPYEARDDGDDAGIHDVVLRLRAHRPRHADHLADPPPGGRQGCDDRRGDGHHQGNPLILRVLAVDQGKHLKEAPNMAER